MTTDSMTLNLVNLNQTEPRKVIVQAGGYAEHHFNTVTVQDDTGGDATSPVDYPWFTVELQPGCGSRLEISMSRYANPPTMAFPWD